MAKVETLVNILDPPEKFAEMIVDRPKALREVGALLTSEAQSAFARGGWRGEKPWPPRRVPNVAGIVLDLAQGGAVKARRLSADRTLVDTGRLRGNFNFRVDEEAGSVTLSNFTPYADEVHRGGARGPFPGAKTPGPVRDGLTKFLRSHPEHRKTLGWLFSREEWSYSNVPPRPLVPVGGRLSKPILDDVQKIVLSHRLGAEEG